jgi:hypothetical protein
VKINSELNSNMDLTNFICTYFLHILFASINPKYFNWTTFELDELATVLVPLNIIRKLNITHRQVPYLLQVKFASKLLFIKYKIYCQIAVTHK